MKLPGWIKVIDVKRDGNVVTFTAVVRKWHLGFWKVFIKALFTNG